MGKAPDPTPPRETSAAQTGSSVSTSIANAFLQNMNETTADGTKTFDQTGSYSFTDPYTGQSYTVPRFSVTQTLSEAQQGIKDQNDRASLNLSTLGADLSGKLGNQLTDNFQLGNENVESRLFDLGRKRLDPMFAQRDEDLRTRLANQGIKAGSQAYDREMGNQGQQQNDAYNQLLLQGRGQASNELLTEDNQRINQISALLSGGQVSQPNFMTGANVNGIPITDNASIIGNYDNALMNQWKQNQAATGSMIGGIGGLFSGGATSAMSGLMSLSDERAKTDKEKIGETKDGLGIYSFKYKGSPKTEIGLMAQEVKKKKPRAVGVRSDGLMAVDYGKALQ
jgi:hypothetical protein